MPLYFAFFFFFPESALSLYLAMPRAPRVLYAVYISSERKKEKICVLKS